MLDSVREPPMVGRFSSHGLGSLGRADQASELGAPWAQAIAVFPLPPPISDVETDVDSDAEDQFETSHDQSLARAFLAVLVSAPAQQALMKAGFERF